jgi:hypothetical protein
MQIPRDSGKRNPLASMACSNMVEKPIRDLSFPENGMLSRHEW